MKGKVIEKNERKPVIHFDIEVHVAEKKRHFGGQNLEETTS